MRAVVEGFVVEDDDQAGEAGEEGEGVEEAVGEGALAFLGGGVRWLQDEEGLG